MLTLALVIKLKGLSVNKKTKGCGKCVGNSFATTLGYQQVQPSLEKINVMDQLRKNDAASRACKMYWEYILWFVVDCCHVYVWVMYRLASTRLADGKEEVLCPEGIYFGAGEGVGQ